MSVHPGRRGSEEASWEGSTAAGSMGLNHKDGVYLVQGTALAQMRKVGRAPQVPKSLNLWRWSVGAWSVHLVTL